MEKEEFITNYVITYFASRTSLHTPTIKRTEDVIQAARNIWEVYQQAKANLEEDERKRTTG